MKSVLLVVVSSTASAVIAQPIQLVDREVRLVVPTEWYEMPDSGLGLVERSGSRETLVIAEGGGGSGIVRYDAISRVDVELPPTGLFASTYLSFNATILDPFEPGEYNTGTSPQARMSLRFLVAERIQVLIEPTHIFEASGEHLMAIGSGAVLGRYNDQWQYIQGSNVPVTGASYTRSLEPGNYILYTSMTFGYLANYNTSNPGARLTGLFDWSVNMTIVPSPSMAMSLFVAAVPAIRRRR